MRFTEEYIIQRLEEHEECMVIQSAAGCYPAGAKALWPDIVQSRFDVYGRHAARPVRVRPTAVQLSKSQECLVWIMRLGAHCRNGKIKQVDACKAVTQWHLYKRDDDGQIYRAHKSWRQLAQTLGCSDKTAKNRYRDGIRILTRILNG